jgi:hypothetical protein
MSVECYSWLLQVRQGKIVSFCRIRSMYNERWEEGICEIALSFGIPESWKDIPKHSERFDQRGVIRYATRAFDGRFGNVMEVRRASFTGKVNISTPNSRPWKASVTKQGTKNEGPNLTIRLG